MRNLGVKEAAEAIRGAFFVDRAGRMDPEQAHQMKFAKAVAKELGDDDSLETVHHVTQLLREHDIALHAGHEYPKYATRKWDRTARIVHSEDEEHDWVNEAQPEPQDPDDLPPLRVLDEPVQDLSVDLRNKVPHMADDAPPPERVARVPNAVTNREAAQDAYARQPGGANRDRAAAAYDRANPGLDRRNADAAVGEGEFVDHDEDVLDIDDLAQGGDKAQGGAPYAKPADVGVMAHDDPDGDGSAGLDVYPTHDSVLGTDKPQPQSSQSSAGNVQEPVRRPVGNRRPL